MVTTTAIATATAATAMLFALLILFCSAVLFALQLFCATVCLRCFGFLSFVRIKPFDGTAEHQVIQEAIKFLAESAGRQVSQRVSLG